MLREQSEFRPPQVPGVPLVYLDRSFSMARISKQILYSFCRHRIEFDQAGINLDRLSI